MADETQKFRDIIQQFDAPEVSFFSNVETLEDLEKANVMVVRRIGETALSENIEPGSTTILVETPGEDPLTAEIDPHTGTVEKHDGPSWDQTIDASRTPYSEELRMREEGLDSKVIIPKQERRRQ